MNKNFILRVGIAGAIIIAWIAIANHQSSNPQLFSRYSYNFFTFLVTSSISALVCLWIVAGSSRYMRLTNRIGKIPIVGVLITIVCTIALIDLFTNLNEISVVTALPIFFVAAIWFSALQYPLRTLNQLALLTSSTLFAIVIVEIIFQCFLIDYKVPKTEKGFSKWIANAWPRKISVQKKSDTFRILGLADSFGRAGKDKNYHYLLEALSRNDNKKLEVINFSVGEYEQFAGKKRSG